MNFRIEMTDDKIMEFEDRQMDLLSPNNRRNRH